MALACIVKRKRSEQTPRNPDNVLHKNVESAHFQKLHDKPASCRPLFINNLSQRFNECVQTDEFYR